MEGPCQSAQAVHILICFPPNSHTGGYAILAVTSEEHEAFDKDVFEYDFENNMQLGM